MDCNKDEAMRAKSIAENKMQLKDFVAARKIALKAQQLFPELENIPHILTVCEVHCSAAMKVNGSEDWYGILQVDSTADDLSIKKQYRKLALLLHPDKNKLPGAEAAFKLIGEAHRTLSDRAKRSLYDVKRRTSVSMVTPKPQPQQPNGDSFSRVVPNHCKNDSTTHFTGLNQQKPMRTARGQTFWTFCPNCGVRYEYYRDIMLRNLHCQNCKKSFIAYDLNVKAVPLGMNLGSSSKQPGPQHKGFSVQATYKTTQQNHSGNASSSMDFQGNVGGGPRVSELQSKVGNCSEHGRSRNKAKEETQVDSQQGKETELKFEKVKLGEVNNREQPVKCSEHRRSRNKAKEETQVHSHQGKETELKFEKVKLGEVKNRKQPVKFCINSKRKRTKTVEISDTDSSDIEEVMIDEAEKSRMNANTTSMHCPRRSRRQKQNVTYIEDLSDDDDFVNPPKRLRKGGPLHDTDHTDKSSNSDEVKTPVNGVDFKKEVKNKYSILKDESFSVGNIQTGKDKRNLSAHEAEVKREEIPEVEIKSRSGAPQPSSDPLSYPETEFFDFEKREAILFAVNQIWALYDDVDGMPRFYARIKKVYSPGFKVQFNWLEFVPEDLSAEIEWSEQDLPVACGNFTLGETENSDQLPIFSHLVAWEKGARKSYYVIHPRKGEVWALYKGWDIKWSSDPENHRSFEYEIVEVLSDNIEGSGISVAPLVWVKSFVSLFIRSVNDGDGILQIPRREMLRFSHMIPSYRISGKEREGLPNGSYELDPAALPADFEKKIPSVSLNLSKEKIRVENHSAFLNKEMKLAKDNIREDQNPRSKVVFSEHNFGVAEKNNQGRSSCSVSESRKRACGGTGASKFKEKEKNLSSPSCTRGGSKNHNDLPVSSQDTEFHNFLSDKSYDKFQRGQIWALYSSDMDCLPKCHAIIRGINLENSKVTVTWLDACPMKVDDVKWYNKGLPLGCGLFKLSTCKDRKDVSVTSTAFSHLAQANPAERKNQFYIYPNAGEVWAMYRNWSVDWGKSDINGCDYDLVEVLSSSTVILVLYLEKVTGYRTVFMPKKDKGAPSTAEIPQTELLRFSHCVPFFRLTKERCNSRWGYLELDPLSVPKVLCK